MNGDYVKKIVISIRVRVRNLYLRKHAISLPYTIIYMSLILSSLAVRRLCVVLIIYHYRLYFNRYHLRSHLFRVISGATNYRCTTRVTLINRLSSHLEVVPTTWCILPRNNIYSPAAFRTCDNLQVHFVCSKFYSIEKHRDILVVTCHVYLWHA